MGFHLYEVPIRVTSTETESMVEAGGWRKEIRTRLMSIEFQFGEMKTFWRSIELCEYA